MGKDGGDDLGRPVGGNRRGVVEDVAQAEYGAAADGAQRLQRAGELAARAQRALVRNHHVRPE